MAAGGRRVNVREFIDALERVADGQVPSVAEVCLYTPGTGMFTPVMVWLAEGKLVFSGSPPPDGHRLFPSLWDQMGD